MLMLLLKRNLKVLLLRRPVSKPQKNPSTLIECLEKPDRPRFSKKQLFFISCLIFVFFYKFCYWGTIVADDVHDSNYEEYFNEIEYSEIKAEFMIENTLHFGNYSTGDSTESGLDVLNTTVTEITTKRRPIFQNDLSPKYIASFMNKTVIVKKNLSGTDDLERLYPEVDVGGHFIPRDRRARHKVAILVPFRRREEQLRVFLYNIHPFLMRQTLEYRIVVIEQSVHPFNRGSLFNAGFLEIQMIGDYQCVVFHDVDLLPVDYGIDYSCPIMPRHLCAEIVEENQLNVSATKKAKFNGVTAMTMWQYRQVNGYSNSYWGGHGEDEDMLKRLHVCGLGVTGLSKTLGRYTCLSNRSQTNIGSIEDKLIKSAVARYKKDGLSNIRYKKISYATHHLYTRILVDINPTKKDILN